MPRLTTKMQFGALQIKLPTFPPTSKVIFSTLHSSVRRQLVRRLGLNCALNVQNKIFGGFWAQNTIKMKREVRRIHWYTAENEKTNDTKVIKDQTYCIFHN